MVAGCQALSESQEDAAASRIVPSRGSPRPAATPRLAVEEGEAVHDYDLHSHGLGNAYMPSSTSAAGMVFPPDNGSLFAIGRKG